MKYQVLFTALLIATCNGLHLKTPRPAIKAFSDQD